MKNIQNKNEEILQEFIIYCNEHPKYRFFQALRNFIQETIDPKWNWLYVSDGKDTEDTFHWENKEPLKVKDINIKD